jgi:hypothetical protein
MNNDQSRWEASRLRALDAPIPVQTTTYSPVSHGEIFDQIATQLVANNLASLRNRVHINGNGGRMVGFVDVEPENEFGKQHGLKMMLGYRNSYDKSMSVGFAAGASVWICGNGIISGDILSFRRKHTGSVSQELNNRITDGINLMKNEFMQLNMEVDVMKGFNLTQRQKAEILGVMYFERNLVTPTQLSIVKHELTQSPHFKEDNAWSLYNNVTEALKKSHPVDIIPDHIKFHRFMREMTGITVAETVTPDAQPEAEG